VDRDKIVQSMLDDFKLSSEAEADNRTRALFILDFTRPGAKQFNPQEITARGSRPSYSFNQLPKFGRQVINDQWQNVPQIKYIPKTDADVEKAEILEDMVREVQSQGCAQTAYKMAIASQVSMGWGYFAFATDYDNDESNDQNIYIREIPNTFQVYDDPACRKQDRSDRRFLIEVEDLPLTEFNRRENREYARDELQSVGSEYPSWATMGENLVRVGHYWRMEYDKETVWFNKETGEKVTEQPKDFQNYNERVIKKPRVMYYKCTAKEKLEGRKWQGSHIPYCFVEGNKTVVNGKTYLTGIYEDMISTQVLFNYATNTAIELAESAPISPFTVPLRGVAGLEKYYDTVNRKNYAYLPYNDIDENGLPITPPQRLQNGADLSSAVALIQMAEQNFYGTSGIYPASLGQQSNEKSGKAILARQREGDVSTSNYADTFRRALLYGGIIFQDLSKKIYDGSREIQVMSEDKKTRVVKINQKYKDPKTGKVIEYDMTKGEMGVAVTTGPSFTTKREEARESQIALLQAYPQAMLPALPDIVRGMDWPNADKTAEAIERGLPPELRDPESQKEQMQGVPPAVQAQLQQAQQIIQQIGQALQEVQQQNQQLQQEIVAKQNEIELAKQTGQSQKVQDALKAQYDKLAAQQKIAELTIANREKDLEIQFKDAQAMLAQQLQPESQPTNEMDEETLMSGLGENALRGYEMDKQVKMQQEQAEAQMKAAEAEQQRQNMAMLIESLSQMQANIVELSNDIRAPKVIDVKRNPQTGLIEQAYVVPQ
jgi:hypothetical protein